MVSPRRKPTRVMPVCSASSTARLEGALTAAIRGTPATAAFWTTSNEHRPETNSTRPVSGRRPSVAAHPITLSTALWRPTSSRTQSTPPSASQTAAACSPPVCSNTRWASRTRSGIAARTREGTARPSVATVGERDPGPQVDGEHVELLGLPLGSADAHRLDIVGTGDQALADAVADGQLDVVARRPHGDADRVPGHPQLQRLLNSQPVPRPPGLAPSPDLQHPALGNPPPRHRRLPSSAVPSTPRVRPTPPARPAAGGA